MNKRTILAAVLGCLLFTTAAAAQTTWQDTIKKANERVHRREACSVLGTCPTWDLARNKARTVADKQRSQYKTAIQKDTDKTLRYETIIQGLQNSQKQSALFENYTLTAKNEEFFTLLTDTENAALNKFLRGEGTAEIHKETVNGLIHFYVKTASFTLDICPEIRLVILLSLDHLVNHQANENVNAN